MVRGIKMTNHKKNLEIVNKYNGVFKIVKNSMLYCNFCKKSFRFDKNSCTKGHLMTKKHLFNKLT